MPREGALVRETLPTPSALVRLPLHLSPPRLFQRFGFSVSARMLSLQSPATLNAVAEFSLSPGPDLVRFGRICYNNPRPAVSATKRSLSGVNILVSNPVTVSSEAFSTLAAGVGSLSCVNALVLLQMDVLSEALSAQSAVERPLSRVSALVFFKR